MKILITKNRDILSKVASYSKSNKKTASQDLPIIDPKTLNRKEPYALFIGTQRYSKDIAVDLFDVFGEHPMITESNRVPTVTLEVLERENIPVIGKAPRAGDKQPIQDLSGVVKIANLKQADWMGEGWWISPIGEVQKLFPGEEHEKNLSPDLESVDEEDLNGSMLAEGWIRARKVADSTELGLGIANVHYIPDFLDDFILQVPSKTIGIEDGTNYVVVNYEDAVKSGLQKAVNKALQQKRMGKQGQLGSEYDFSSTHFLLPKEFAEKIIRWAVETIPEDQIVYDSKDPGTKGIQLESHITLKYGLKTNDFDEVKKALDGEKAPHIKFNKTSFFEPEGKDYDVVIIPVESEDLQKLNEKLCSQVKHEDLQFKEYHPHVTVAYVKKGLGATYDGKDIITGEELDLDILTFSPKVGEKRELELKKGTEKEASRGMAAWIDPKGIVYYLRETGAATHAEWIGAHPKEWFRQFGLDLDNYLDSDLEDADQDWGEIEISIQNDLISMGWTRVGDITGAEGEGFQVCELLDIPRYLFDYFSKLAASKPSKEITIEDLDNRWVTLPVGEAAIGQKAVNKALQQKRLQTQSSFMPSNTDLAPSDDWAGTVGYPTNQSMDAPQNVSDEETWYSPENDRPRSKNFLKRMLSLFQKPLSKKKPTKNIVPVKEAEIEKKASDKRAWVDPNGKVFYTEGDIHASWVNDNLEFLERDYGFKVPKRVYNQRMQYYKLMEEGQENVDLPDIWGIELAMFDSGWTRIGDVAYDKDIGIELKNLRTIPSFLDSILSQFVRDGQPIVVADRSKNSVVVTYPFKSLQQQVNKALSSPTKTATVKKAHINDAYWIDPSGKVFTVRKEFTGHDTASHASWMWENKNLLQKKYGITFYGDEDEIMTSMIDTGWVRIDHEPSEQTSITLANIRSIPSYVEDFVARFSNENQPIMVEDVERKYVEVTPPFTSLQKAINEALSHKRLTTAKQLSKKEASSNVFMLETDSGLQTKALKDPTPEQAENLFNSTRGEVHQLRWFIPIDGHLYMWDAYDLTHWDAIKQIGIPATKLAEDMNTGVARTSYEAEIIAEEFKEFGIVNMNKQAKQWVTPKEPINQPGMDWQWADYIYNYVDENWQDLLMGWMNLDPKNYVKPVILIEKIYEDEGGVSAWVHIEFVNTAGNTDAFMKLVISADIHYEPSYEPEGVETTEYLDNWEIEVLDYGKSDELEKSSSYGPTNYQGPSVADDNMYQDSPYNMNVTWSPEEDEELDDQNGAGGYPNRWFGRHRGPYYTNEGKVVKMLEETSALETLPPQQPITENTNAGTAILMDDGSIYWSDEPRMIHVQFIKQLGIPVERIVSGGRIVDGDYHDLGPRSDTMRYVEQQLAKKRVEQKRRALGKKDIKADLSGQTINDILKIIQQTGGATYNLSKGNLVGTDAYAVAIYPDKEQIVDEADFDNLEGYLTSNEGLLSNSNNSFGAWVSNGKTYYDVVTTITDKNEAMKLGQQHNQLAIFSLKDMKEIPLSRTAKLAAANQAYWIDPSGEVYNVYGKTHDIWMVDESNLLKNKYGIDATKEDWRNLIERGWTRVNASDDSVSLEVLDIHKIPVFINKFIKEYVGETPKVFIEDRMNNSVTIPFFRGMIPKQAAAVSDAEQQKYYDEIYSDRWRDDSSKIDGGNEYYDWSELGSNDHPNPKDEEKEHVYMDMLDDPAVANFPAGLPEYWVTFYDSNSNQGDQGGV